MVQSWLTNGARVFRGEDFPWLKGGLHVKPNVVVSVRRERVAMRVQEVDRDGARKTRQVQ